MWLALLLSGCPQDVPDSGQFGADVGTVTDTGTGSVTDTDSGTVADTVTVSDTVAGTDTVTVSDTGADTVAVTDTAGCKCTGGNTCPPSGEPCLQAACISCKCTTKPVPDNTGCGGGKVCKAGKCVLGALPWAVDVAAGGAHTCAIHGSGEVSCWGRNSQGQVGKGGPSAPESFETKPVPALGLVAIKALASRSEHGCALGKDGKVRCWGDNFRGQIGNGTKTNDAWSPTLALGLDAVDQIATGRDFSLALRSNGELWGWGHGGYYKLLDPTISNAAKPKQIGKAYGVKGIKGMCAGGKFACAIWPDNSVKCWGQGGAGEIGGGKYKYNYQAKQPEAVLNIKGIVELACGDSHVCAREANGTVWCWGNNLHEQVSNALKDTSIAIPAQPAGVGKMVELAVGQSHSCGRTAKGSVICWGDNTKGQLGVEGKPVGKINEVVLKPMAAAITAGWDYSCAVRNDGKVLCWGANKYGQLGNGSDQDSATPVVVVADGG